MFTKLMSLLVVVVIAGCYGPYQLNSHQQEPTYYDIEWARVRSLPSVSETNKLRIGMHEGDVNLILGNPQKRNCFYSNSCQLVYELYDHKYDPISTPCYVYVDSEGYVTGFNGLAVSSTSRGGNIKSTTYSGIPNDSTAYPRTTFDPISGNSYKTSTTSFGNTRVEGFNYSTGAMWETTIKKDGSMRGYDKDMNPWDYNSKTGTYINYGTGKICVGEGELRSCF